MIVNSFYGDKRHDFKRDNLIELRQIIMRLKAIATSEKLDFIYATERGITLHEGKDADGMPLAMTVLAEDIDEALEGDQNVTQ